MRKTLLTNSSKDSNISATTFPGCVDSGQTALAPSPDGRCSVSELSEFTRFKILRRLQSLLNTYQLSPVNYDYVRRAQFVLRSRRPIHPVLLTRLKAIEHWYDGRRHGATYRKRAPAVQHGTRQVRRTAKDCRADDHCQRRPGMTVSTGRTARLDAFLTEQFRTALSLDQS